MRARLSSFRRLRRRARGEERGAFALIFAAVVILLLVISAFTVDFGQAYVSKRQLQSAADAGALAAAQVYKGQTMSCSQLLTNASLKNDAQSAADKWAQMNRPGAVGTSVVLGCDADGGLTVDYGTSGETPQVFGGLVTGHSTITTDRSAQATIGGVGGGGKLRPWGICSGITKTLNQVVFVPTDGGATAQGETSAGLCGTNAPPGGWWVAQCVGQGNGTPSTQDAVENGCKSTTTYTVVPDQSTHNSSPQTLFAWMTAACPKAAVGPYCLSSDTGNNATKQTQSQWQGLVGDSFTMPVFCGKTDCSDLAVSAQGNNASYPIEMIASVTLCGFYMKQAADANSWPKTGLCATANPKNYKSSDITKGAGFFLVITGLTGGPGNLTVPGYSDTSLTK